MLADFYGPQRLLRRNLLPARVDLPHIRDFCAPCHGVPVPGGIYLHSLFGGSRAFAGWTMVGDRRSHPGAPSGAGYALENRLVSQRVLPDVFRATHVRRLATFFQSYRETLRSLVPHIARTRASCC